MPRHCIPPRRVRLLRVYLLLLSGLADHDVSAVGPRHRAVHENHVASLVDADDLQVTGRDPLVAPASGHLFALGDLTAVTAVGAVRRNTAARPMVALHAMAGPRPLEIVL